ncbi:hypothetical protein CR983_00560 [Candidatus Saccharibacteria bacterium]|nr:MAG: hypothetical protein CR983_00560 [Candidatus Saccharibacteria bacterium]
MVKIPKPKIRRSKKNIDKSSARITNDTVAEHRERVLAEGRRYKYPVQYVRRRLVINAVAISMLTFVALVAFGWWQLYHANNSNTFFYRVTQLVPLPVANVDGSYARFSDYLLNYRASEHYLSKYDEIRADSDDGKLQLQYKRREALDLALADAYARKIATEHNLSVDDEEVEEVLESLRSAANGQLSRETSNASSERVLGLSEADLKTLVHNSILRSKAAFAIDKSATKLASLAEKQLAKDKDLQALAAYLNEQRKDSAGYGVSGLVSTSATFGGLQAAEIAKLKEGAVKGPLKSITSEGYYFVQVVKKTDSQVSFAFVRIPLMTFDKQLAELKESDKISEYITIDIDQQ